MLIADIEYFTINFIPGINNTYPRLRVEVRPPPIMDQDCQHYKNITKYHKLNALKFIQ